MQPHPQPSFSARQLFIALSLLVMLFFGCGQKQGSSAYDTDKNPENFPEAALALIRDVEGDHYSSYNQIVNAFMDLYERHPDLLDNQEWRTVIGRVGVMFRKKGDASARQGLTHYQEASEYFSLAASARADDPRTTEGSQLFAVWEQAVAQGLFPQQVTDEWLKGLTLTKRIDLLKHFVFRDSLSRTFARQYLANQLMDEALLQEKAAGKSGMTVSRSDSAFLAYIGQVKSSRVASLASFENPDIDIIACQLLYIGDSIFAIETYLRPTKKIDQNFLISLNLAKQDTVSTPHVKEPDYHIEFSPIPQPTYWESGKIALAVCSLKVDSPVGRLSLSLVTQTGEHARYIPVAGTGAHQVTMTPTIRLQGE